MNPYWKEYEWSNVFAMLKNNKSQPAETGESCNGKLVVLTGATSGIGYHTARYYASRGARLLCINRNEEKSLHLQQEIESEFGGECRYFIADFSRLSEVHLVAQRLEELPDAIDILIHNAGVFNTQRRLTEDGLEEVFQVNYLASFIINYRLMEKLKAQSGARVIYVNSEGHRFALDGIQFDDLDWHRRRYTGLKSYGAAKTAQLLSMFPFNEVFEGSGVTLIAMHPGDVRTNMGENNGGLYRFMKHHFVNKSARDPRLSAQALYFLGVAPELEGIRGRFYNFTTEEIPAPHALDQERATRLWEVSKSLGGCNDE